MMVWLPLPMCALCRPRGDTVKPSRAHSSAAAWRSCTAITTWSSPSMVGSIPVSFAGTVGAGDAAPQGRPGEHRMSETKVVWPPSLWAAVTPPGPDLPALRGAETAEVAVIGAGFTGLSTVLHLRRAGVDVAVVEAAEPGWGASGRNNGQVIPTLSRPDPEDIGRRHGAAGERFVRLLRDSATILFDLAREEGIEAEAEQNGWVRSEEHTSEL